MDAKCTADTWSSPSTFSPLWTALIVCTWSFFGRKLLQLLSFPLGMSSVISYGIVKGKLIIGPHSQHVQAYVLHIKRLRQRTQSIKRDYICSDSFGCARVYSGLLFSRYPDGFFCSGAKMQCEWGLTFTNNLILLEPMTAPFSPFPTFSLRWF